jgi:branched-chain amino acid aminotransferase
MTTPFGKAFTARMSVARWADGSWSAHELTPVAPLDLHPAAHALHYGSSCFEGLKAHRGDDGVVRAFRLDAHLARLQTSTQSLSLPVPPIELARKMVLDLVRDSLDDVPAPPGSLYLRPTVIGTEPNIGAAAHPSSEALFFVLASPVGDYFAGGDRPLVLAVETEQPRTTPQFGMVKAGANYAMALNVTLAAREAASVDQVLFAPGGGVQETGASNVILVDGERLITPTRTTAFLHGITLDSLLQLAGDLGYAVEERPVEVGEVLDWARRPSSEIALSGTAAVLAGVGELVHEGSRLPVGSGEVGPNTRRLRQALTELHRGTAPDPRGWLTAVER